MTLAPGWEIGATVYGNERIATIISLSEELCEILITSDAHIASEDLPLTWTGTLSDLFCGWRLTP